MDDQKLALLSEIQRKLLWLSCWTIHHANHLRSKADASKIGGTRPPVPRWYRSCARSISPCCGGRIASPSSPMPPRSFMPSNI